MFCFQCEQTIRVKDEVGCQRKRGQCGKESDTADLQDLLNYTLKGIGMYAHRARLLGAIDADVDGFVPGAIFTTLTNVNFDETRFLSLIPEAIVIRDKAKLCYESACERQGKTPEQLTGAATWQAASDKEGLLAQAEIASINAGKDEVGADVIGMRSLLLYGLKGCSAYWEHARILGDANDEAVGGILKFLSYLGSDPTDLNEMLENAMAMGQLNLLIMEALDHVSTGRYGHPEVTQVRVNPTKGKAILVSGHDLVDLEEILKQTAGKGINVYTHGELLPAHAYPSLKAYPHLVGNYGGAWQDQQTEFAKFPGPIVLTSNCMIDPRPGNYQSRIYTSGPVGWKEVPHIENHDYSAVIAQAEGMVGFPHEEIEQTITTGFARNTVMNVAGDVVDAVKSGAIKHFFLIGGCDGAMPGRNYFTEVAEQTPDDTVILTLGCGKYRFNKKITGDIGGIPRVLDIGQCNDAYSAIKIAVALSEAFECGVNDLPLSMVISWFEQKAAAVLLTLLSLGIKNIRLGPTLPPFLTPALVDILVDQFDLKAVGDAGEDIKNMMAGA